MIPSINQPTFHTDRGGCEIYMPKSASYRHFFLKKKSRYIANSNAHLPNIEVPKMQTLYPCIKSHIQR